jgi:AhpD family alkylhydroperoxidase
LAPLYRASQLVRESSLEPKLIELVDMRASQINGCTFCLALHAREAEALGEERDRLACLSAWREAPWYTDRERAALEWTESLTRVAETNAPDDVFQCVSAVFSPEEIVYLTLAVSTINTWNRFAIAFRNPPEKAQATFEYLQSQKGR